MQPERNPDVINSLAAVAAGGTPSDVSARLARVQVDPGLAIAHLTAVGLIERAPDGDLALTDAGLAAARRALADLDPLRAAIAAADAQAGSRLRLVAKQTPAVRP